MIVGGAGLMMIVSDWPRDSARIGRLHQNVVIAGRRWDAIDLIDVDSETGRQIQNGESICGEPDAASVKLKGSPAAPMIVPGMLKTGPAASI